MSSIPLPALGIKTPEQPNALETLRGIQQLQAGQQEQQQRKIAIQNAQMQQQDQVKLRDLYVKHGGDLDKVLQEAPTAGVSPQTIQKLQLHSIDAKTKTAELVAKQGANAVQQADLMQGAHDAVDKAPTEQKPAIYQQQLQQLAKMGVDTSQMPPQYPGDEPFKLVGAMVKGHKQQVEDAFKAAETAKNAAQAGEAEAQTRKINAEINADNPADPNIRKQKYESILSKIQEGGVGSISAKDMEFAKSYELGQRKTTTQSDSLGVTSVNTSTPSGIAGAAAGSGRGAPAQGGGNAGGGGSISKPQSTKDSLVDAIGQYKYNPMLLSRISIKHPDILAAVTQKYPDWSQPQYNAANKAVTDLAPGGKTGQQITSYNTFLRHAGALYDAVDSLDNSKSSDLLNKPLNWLRQHTGDPRVADFMAAMQPPMKEFQSFLLNNHAMHDEDVKDAHNLIDENKTPQEIRAVLKRFAETGSARLSEQNESFKRVTGRDIPNLVSPQAAAAYNKITGNSGGAASGMVRFKDSQGNMHDIPAANLGKAKERDPGLQVINQ